MALQYYFDFSLLLVLRKCHNTIMSACTSFFFGLPWSFSVVGRYLWNMLWTSCTTSCPNLVRFIFEPSIMWSFVIPCGVRLSARPWDLRKALNICSVLMLTVEHRTTLECEARGRAKRSSSAEGSREDEKGQGQGNGAGCCMFWTLQQTCISSLLHCCMLRPSYLSHFIDPIIFGEGFKFWALIV